MKRNIRCDLAIGGGCLGLLLPFAYWALMGWLGYKLFAWLLHVLAANGVKGL